MVIIKKLKPEEYSEARKRALKEANMWEKTIKQHEQKFVEVGQMKKEDKEKLAKKVIELMNSFEIPLADYGKVFSTAYRMWQTELKGKGDSNAK